MRSIILSGIIFILLAGCKASKGKPDVSDIKLNVVTQRFEQDLFAVDTSNFSNAVADLFKKYPGFMNDFMVNILGIPQGDPQAGLILKKFIADFKPVKAAADQKFRDFSSQSAQLTLMMKYVRHYFPSYPLPAKIITFVGPMDAFYESSLGWSGDIITTEGLGIGLQLHLGSNSLLYAEEGGQGYPQYISRRFEPEYITINAARNIIDDLYPVDQSKAKPLVDVMVDKGKRLYILDHICPDIHDTLKIGYSGPQLAGALKNEGLIWNMFAENNLLYETDFQKLKSFVGEGPKTPELGDESPGYISLFTGWRIVKAYMEKYPETTLQQLTELDNRKLFELSKYKPK